MKPIENELTVKLARFQMGNDSGDLFAHEIGVQDYFSGNFPDGWFKTPSSDNVSFAGSMWFREAGPYSLYREKGTVTGK